jgi:proteasome lid subunit RPN8/RPN11
VLLLDETLWERVVAHCLDGLPFEACGLLAGATPVAGASHLVPSHSTYTGALGTGALGTGALGTGALGTGALGTGALGTGALASAPAGAQPEGTHSSAEGLTALDAGIELTLHQPAEVHEVFPTGNASRSARLYTVEPRDLLAADRAAERSGWSLIGVWHSHTHTPAYPSPTDIAQAPDPSWHYVVVSLADTEPVLRSYRVIGGEVYEEPVTSPLALGRQVPGLARAGFAVT